MVDYQLDNIKHLRVELKEENNRATIVEIEDLPKDEIDITALEEGKGGMLEDGKGEDK